MNKIVKPLHNFVLVKMLPKAGVTEGGIQLPDSAEMEPEKGTVVAVGPGHWDTGKLIPIGINVGDTVYLGRYKGALGITIKGTLHILVPSAVCVATIVRRV